MMEITQILKIYFELGSMFGFIVLICLKPKEFLLYFFFYPVMILVDIYKAINGDDGNQWDEKS